MIPTNQESYSELWRLSRPVELHSPVSNSMICFEKHARVQLKQKHHFNVCLHNNKQTDVNFSDFFFFPYEHNLFFHLYSE